MLIDTHCHLDAAEFAHDAAEVASRAAEVGVAGIVIPAVERGNWRTVQALAHATPGAVYALGIHPMFVAHAQDEDLDALDDAVAAALSDPRFVAVGEIGLDFFDPAAIAASERQQRFYAAQLKLAARRGLPVLLHVRRAQDQVLKGLRRTAVPGGCAHAFNGSLQQAQAFAALGCKLGMGGMLTFERALQVRRIATQMTIDTLVLETDAPDIAPAWIRANRNSPAELPGIAAQLAQLRGLSFDELASATSRNARAVLPRMDAWLLAQADARQSATPA